MGNDESKLRQPQGKGQDQGQGQGQVQGQGQEAHAQQQPQAQPPPPAAAPDAGPPDPPGQDVRREGSGGGGGKRQALRDLVGEVVSVVRQDQAQAPLTEPALQALQETPQFAPLIKSRGFSFTSKSTLEALDAGPVLRMCGRYQAFLKRSSLAVAQEQRVINANLKRVENMSGRALSIFSQKANELKRFEMRFREVSQLEAKVESVTAALARVVATAERLNGRLPAALQLEHLEFVAPRALKRTPAAASAHQQGCTRRSSGEAAAYPASGAAALQGKRYSMEDAHVAMDCIREGPAPAAWGAHWAFYAVYDGHGGSATAHYAASHLHRLLLRQRSLTEGKALDALRTAFLETDKQFCAKAMLDGNRSGSTAAVALLVGAQLFVANAGDSEVVLGSYCRREGGGGYLPRQLSRNHKPDDEDERARIVAAGGGVFFGRVSGTLAVARALGDPEFKRPLNEAPGDFVVADPHLVQVELTEADEFLVLACDGLWDVMQYSEAVEYIGGRREVEPEITPEEVARELADDAVNKRGSTDNVSVVVVFLRPSAALKTPHEATAEQQEGTDAAAEAANDALAAGAPADDTPTPPDNTVAAAEDSAVVAEAEGKEAAADANAAAAEAEAGAEEEAQEHSA